MTIPSWLVALIIGNTVGLFTNMAVIVWWASKVNTWVTDLRHEVREIVRPKLHDHANLLTVHTGHLEELERRLTKVEAP